MLYQVVGSLFIIVLCLLIKIAPPRDFEKSWNDMIDPPIPPLV